MLDDLNSYAAHRGRKSATAAGANETDYEDDDGADGVVVVVSDHRLTSLKGNGSHTDRTDRAILGIIP